MIATIEYINTSPKMANFFTVHATLTYKKQVCLKQRSAIKLTLSKGILPQEKFESHSKTKQKLKGYITSLDVSEFTVNNVIKKENGLLVVAKIQNTVKLIQ